jgi:hypothetical protein
LEKNEKKNRLTRPRAEGSANGRSSKRMLKTGATWKTNRDAMCIQLRIAVLIDDEATLRTTTT